MSPSFATDISAQDFFDNVRGSGIRFQTGPFVIRLHSNSRSFTDTWRECYRRVPLLSNQHIAHFRINILNKRSIRRSLRPQISFQIEDHEPFDPYPLDHAFPMFEWGLNWCFGTMAHQHLMLHSAAVEKHGKAVLMPAQPGSGKSTLCAAMVGQGWRLLSDEFGLIELGTRKVLPLPRAAPLKNNSINVIKNFCPQLRLGPVFHRTRKGTVSHVFPPDQAIERQQDPATPAIILFPRYEADSKTQLTDQARSVALTRLVNNSFNYLITGEPGFEALCHIVKRSACKQLVYSDLDEALATVEATLEDVS